MRASAKCRNQLPMLVILVLLLSHASARRLLSSSDDTGTDVWEGPSMMPGPALLSQECTCTCPLKPQALVNENGCRADVSCGEGDGALCEGPADTILSGGCACTGGSCKGNVSYCAGTPAMWFPPNVVIPLVLAAGIVPGEGGGALCYQTCCPRDGTIHIQGSSLSNCSGVADNLFLYRGNFSNMEGAELEGLSNQQSVNFIGNCTAGTCFSLCEKTGIILTKSIKSSISFTVPAAVSGTGSVCPSGCEESCGTDASVGSIGLPRADDFDDADGSDGNLPSLREPDDGCDNDADDE